MGLMAENWKFGTKGFSTTDGDAYGAWSYRISRVGTTVASDEELETIMNNLKAPIEHLPMLRELREFDRKKVEQLERQVEDLTNENDKLDILLKAARIHSDELRAVLGGKMKELEALKKG